MVTDNVRNAILNYVRQLAAMPAEDVAAQLSETQQLLASRLAGVSDDAAGTHAAPSEWSVRDLTRHMVRAESVVAAFVETLACGDTSLGDLTAPEGDSLEDDSRPFAAWVDDLRQADARLLAALRDLPPSHDLATTALHPFLGPLNCVEWAASQRVHDADHIQHVTRLLTSL